MVKIVTSIPLRRGRWNVVDYPDKEKTTSKEPTAPTASAASIPQAAVQPANPNPQGQSVVTAEIPKSETDSNASNSSVQPPLQPQQPPNFSGAASIPQAAVQPANPNPQGQSVVTAEIPKSETDSNASNSSVQPPLQPQQPPNFSGKKN